MKKRILVLLFLILVTNIFSVESRGFWNNGLFYEKSEDEAFQMRLDIRLYLDYCKYIEDEEYLSDGSYLRKARFAVKSKFWRNWFSELDIDFASNNVEVKDMWVAWQQEYIQLKCGNFKLPFSMEELTSSRLINFMERSYMNELTPGRRMALGYRANWSFGSLSSAIHGQKITDTKNKSNDDGWGYATRLTFSPLNSKMITIHTGGSYACRKPDDGLGIIEFKTEPEAKHGDAEFLNTNEIEHVDNLRLSNCEAAFCYGPVMLQAEYLRADVIRKGNFENYIFEGGYTFISFMISGERRPYSIKEGEFGQIIPTRKIGAFEIAFRYSHLNLSDYKIAEEEYLGVTGGESNSYTSAVTWYFNPNVKWMINYSIIDNSPRADGDSAYPSDYDFDIFQTRLLVVF